MFDEYHDVLPIEGEKHATLFIRYDCQDAIKGVWKSGWDFPTIYTGINNNNKKEAADVQNTTDASPTIHEGSDVKPLRND